MPWLKWTSGVVFSYLATPQVSNALGAPMPDEHLVTTEEFVRIAKMDRTQCYILFMDNKLPITELDHQLYVDIDDIRARQFLPDYKPLKDLF